MKIPAYLLIILIIVAGGCSNRAMKYLASGKEKFQNQDYKGAVADFTKATSKDPSLAEAWFYSGMAKRGFNNNRAGLTIRAVNPDGSKPVAATPKEALTLEDALTNGTGEAFSGGLFMRGEIADFNRALELEPANSDAFYYRAMAYLRFGKKELACPDLGKAASLGNADALYQISINCQ